MIKKSYSENISSDIFVYIDLDESWRRRYNDLLNFWIDWSHYNDEKLIFKLDFKKKNTNKK